jgi:DNA-binding NtrC family response regulator
MNVLIIEDDENKRNQLSHFLREVLPGIEISIARSLNSGLRCLKVAVPDLLILDMTIPNFDPGPDESGGQTHIFGGTEVLRQMDRFDIFCPVVVVTQFETFGRPGKTIKLEHLRRELDESHSPLYRGLVYYHAAIHGWRDDLYLLLKELGLPVEPK